MEIIKQFVCMKFLLIIEVMDAFFMVEGTIEATFPLDLDLLDNYVENMFML